MPVFSRTASYDGYTTEVSIDVSFDEDFDFDPVEFVDACDEDDIVTTVTYALDELDSPNQYDRVVAGITNGTRRALCNALGTTPQLEELREQVLNLLIHAGANPSYYEDQLNEIFESQPVVPSVPPPVPNTQPPAPRSQSADFDLGDITAEEIVALPEDTKSLLRRVLNPTLSAMIDGLDASTPPHPSYIEELKSLL
jgi:hypothetical protein